MKKKIFIILCLGIITTVIWLYPKLVRLNKVNHLFEKEVILENFQHMENIFPVSKINASSNPLVLAEQIDYQLPKEFLLNDKPINTESFLQDTETEGLLIIHKDTIVYEDYQLGLDEEETHISWSMSKSFVATLIGVFVDQGKIDIDKKVSHYLPHFVGSAYENVRVKDLLNMSSGVAFNEDYGDFYSDINRFGRSFAMGTSLENFALSLKKDKPPGTYNHYVSIDTQVLGLILTAVSGESVTSLTQKYIWEPAGMEDSATWIIDNTGMEVVLGGLNATLRDFSKLGLLYLHNGQLNGQNIVSPEWIFDATTPDAKHLEANQLEHSSNPFGYAYQWWLPRFPANDFFANGIYSQYIYINRDQDLVIAKLSADYKFKTGRKLIRDKHLALFQHIASDIEIQK